MTQHDALSDGNCDHDYRCFGHDSHADDLDYDNRYICRKCDDTIMVTSPLYAVFGSTPAELEETGVS